MEDSTSRAVEAPEERDTQSEERAVRKDVHNSDLPLLCRACEARHQGVCGALNPDQLLRLSKSTIKRTVERNTPLQEEEEQQSHYSNILSGVAKLSKILPDGRQQIVGLQFAPDFLGRPFARQSDVTIEAATQMRLCSFPKSVLEEMLAESPEMEHRLHEQTLSELNEARDWLLTLGRKTALEKVASFLLLIASRIDPETSDANSDPTEIELPLKRAEIADFLGLTIETVSRQMTHLRKRGLIELNDRQLVVVTSLKRLRQLSEAG